MPGGGSARHCRSKIPADAEKSAGILFERDL